MEKQVCFSELCRIESEAECRRCRDALYSRSDRVINELRDRADWCHRVTGCSVRHNLYTQAADEIERLQVGNARYEKVRLWTVIPFEAAFLESIRGGRPFDQIVDESP